MPKYNNLISALNPFVPYHDDMHDEEVTFLDFPYIRLFGDFRIFNGIKLSDVDDYVGKIRTVMIDIRNHQEMLTREKQLEEKRE